MDKFIQYFFLILIPFYPLWAWVINTFAKLYLSKIVILLLIPIAVYLVIAKKTKFPKYLIFFSIFTIYHLTSVFINDLVPLDTNWLYFILSDPNFLACVFFFIIENSHFDEKFIRKLNRCILTVVVISLIVSIIQIKFPYFFVNPILYTNKDYVHYIEQGRIFSIFSWIDLNSLGVSFPIMISILLSINSTENITFPATLISGIVVSFLTRARYVMMSALIVFSQLFFVSKIDIRKKIYILLLAGCSIIVLITVARAYDFNIQQVIEDRILEKTTDLASARARVASYEVFLIKFPEHPIFGVGPITRLDVVQLLRGRAPIIHIGYLSYLYFYGIVGSLFIFISIFLLLKKAWTVGKKYLFWGGFYGLLSFCFANITFVYFNLSEMGIILAVIYIKYFNDKSSLELSGDNTLQTIPEKSQELR
ncbi:MAG TPA: O-antigen ligase family protein [Ignavibacteria bacterium]